MALSEYEKQVLRELEDELRSTDPELASELAGPRGRISRDSEEESRHARESLHLSPRMVALGIIGVVLGLLMLVTAVSFGRNWIAVMVGIVGFLVMLCGILAIFFPARKNRGDRKGKRGAPKNSGSGTQAQQSSWSRLMENQQDRWDSREP